MSYLHEIQSRGPGAIAAGDLALSGFWSPVKKIGRKIGLVRKGKPKRRMRVYARRRPGTRRRVFYPRKVGVALPPPSRVVVARPKYPPPRKGPVIRPAIPRHQPVVFKEIAKVGVSPAGILPGRPPVTAVRYEVAPKKYAGVHAPRGPTLATAVAEKKARREAVEQRERVEAELQVPAVVSPRKALGVPFAAAAVGLYFMLRRRR